jgi:hypothetical protein
MLLASEPHSPPSPVDGLVGGGGAGTMGGAGWSRGAGRTSNGAGGGVPGVSSYLARKQI